MENYPSSQIPEPRRSQDPQSHMYASDAVRAPSICLIVFAILSLLMIGVSTLSQSSPEDMVVIIEGFLEGFDPNNEIFDPNQVQNILDQLRSGQMAMINHVITIISVFWYVIILFSGIRMKACRNWSFSVGGSIMAMIPCNCCCWILGLPLGIWCLVTLLKSEVQDGFHEAS